MSASSSTINKRLPANLLSTCVGCAKFPGPVGFISGRLVGWNYNSVPSAWSKKSTRKQCQAGFVKLLVGNIKESDVSSVPLVCVNNSNDSGAMRSVPRAVAGGLSIEQLVRLAHNWFAEILVWHQTHPLPRGGTDLITLQ